MICDQRSFIAIKIKNVVKTQFLRKIFVSIFNFCIGCVD